jgi:hypothetical protein
MHKFLNNLFSNYLGIYVALGIIRTHSRKLLCNKSSMIELNRMSNSPGISLVNSTVLNEKFITPIFNLTDKSYRN